MATERVLFGMSFRCSILFCESQS